MTEGEPGSRRSRWAWGNEDREPTAAELDAVAAGVREMLGFEGGPVEAVPDALADKNLTSGA